MIIADRIILLRSATVITKNGVSENNYLLHIEFTCMLLILSVELLSLLEIELMLETIVSDILKKEKGQFLPKVPDIG
ncbi:hypothetical protein PIROE2DRAFT_17493 [Piromyces sp. E2]|nr:hypothetical protein PIROE2DRAFT_17493 [Piromyces sp. E2]|eukprot:OUM57506.1 hypothetical protein PIROE2DRAFT_17493 [Piromyces sp. E2]